MPALMCVAAGTRVSVSVLGDLIAKDLHGDSNSEIPLASRTNPDPQWVPNFQRTLKEKNLSGFTKIGVIWMTLEKMSHFKLWVFEISE